MTQSKVQLSKNFSLNELQASETALRCGISNEAPDAAVEALKTLVENVLQPLRDVIDAPITISSGYRCQTLNRKVGGARTSQHLYGEAVDIVVKGYTPLQVAGIVLFAGIEFDQMIEECDWLHISYKKGSNRNQTLTAKFSNGKTTYLDGLRTNK